MITASIAIGQVAARLAAAGIEEPRREARLLLAAAHGIDAAGLLLRAELDEAGYEPLVARRCAREPMAYILGHKEFWGLDFAVSPATLIPRADSETLVAAALAHCPAPRCVLDLGTGTGCLLLAVLAECGTAFGVGVDISLHAAALAAHNARSLGLGGRASFIVGDWAGAIAGQFDLLLSNPPYIPQGEITGLMPEVARYEPSRALDGGEDGLDAYRRIIAELPRLLAPGGVAVLELGLGQAGHLAELAGQTGFACTLRQDLACVARTAILTR